jgi:hypothetical protein
MYASSIDLILKSIPDSRCIYIRTGTEMRSGGNHSVLIFCFFLYQDKRKEGKTRIRSLRCGRDDNMLCNARMMNA